MSKTTVTIGKTDDGKALKLDVRRLLVSRMLVTADSGGGKSYLLRKILEQISATTQTIVIDPEGEFATLRELRDMVLVGPGGEVPAEPRSAGLLARRLMELNLSAVIDLSEVTAGRQRQEFVKNFCETLVGLPKSLWQPCFIVIDEAHEFAPEDDKSISETAVAELSVKGRKRGYCLASATQRLSKLSKNVAAGLKNKFLGTFSLDTDIKRAASDLGFGKDRWTEIRDLSSRKGYEGEFFCVGPAFNHRGVAKMRAGEVETSHPEPGQGRTVAPPAPSKKILGVLSELKDLPQQAEAEIKDLAAAKSKIGELERLLRARPKEHVEKEKIVEVPSKRDAAVIARLRAALEQAMKVIAEINATGFEAAGIDPEIVKKAVQSAADQIVKAAQQDVARRQTEFDKLRREATSLLAKLQKLLSQEEVAVSVNVQHNEPFTVKPHTNPDRWGTAPPVIRDIQGRDELAGPEKKVLDSIAFWNTIGVDHPNNSAVALKAGYTPTSSAYERPRGSLRTAGLIEFPKPDHLKLTAKGESLAAHPVSATSLAGLHEAVMKPLDGPQTKLLTALIDAYPDSMTNEELAEASGYTASSSAYERPRGSLRTIGLLEFPKAGSVKATAVLFPEWLMKDRKKSDAA